MHIGIDARFYSSSFTGIGRYVYELASHLCAMDTRNEYTLFFNAPEFEKFVPPRAGVKKVLADAAHYSFDEQWKFWRILENEKLDLMHFTHFNAPLLYRKPCLVTIHDLTLHFYPGKKHAGFLRRIAYQWTVNSIVRRSRRVIAVSEHTKRDLLRLLKADEKKIRVVHEGVNPSFHPIADRRMVEDFLQRSNLEKPYLLYTGVWRSHKNLVNLIKSFAILKREYKFEGLLVITGKEDPWYPEVKETVRTEKLEGEVRFTGLVPDEDLVLLYNGALMYVLPSFYEGFGLPALEAFACGIPVCAARSSSLPEVCGEGNAVFFEPKDPRDMASKIASLYTDTVKMEELRRRGLERVKEFSWETTARKTLAIYQEILRQK